MHSIYVLDQDFWLNVKNVGIVVNLSIHAITHRDGMPSKLWVIRVWEHNMHVVVLEIDYGRWHGLSIQSPSCVNVAASNTSINYRGNINLNVSKSLAIDSWEAFGYKIFWDPCAIVDRSLQLIFNKADYAFDIAGAALYCARGARG